MTHGIDRSFDLFERIGPDDPGWGRPRRWIWIAVVAAVVVVLVKLLVLS